MEDLAAPPPRVAVRVGVCSLCAVPKVISPEGLCNECVSHFRNLRRQHRDREKLLAFGLADSSLIGTAPSAVTPISKHLTTVPPLFILCTLYLSNNSYAIEREAIDYLPSEVRYFLFLLELREKDEESSAPRGGLRLAKRFLAASRSFVSGASFAAFDFSVLRALTCLSMLQIENVFDYLTSFGRPSIEGLRILSFKGMPFLNDAALRTVVAQMPALRVLDLSFCDNISGIAALLPRLKRTAQARDSWEELASDESEDDDTPSTLLCGLVHLRRLGIYGCGQLTRVDLKALRAAYDGRPALTVYTSIIVSEHSEGYSKQQPVFKALEVEAKRWRAATAATGAEGEWGEDEAGKGKSEENKRPNGHEGGGHDEHQEESSGGLGAMFVNDMLQWNVAEEDTLYALRGWQIEQLDDLRCRSQRRQSKLAAPITKRKTRPALYYQEVDEEHWLTNLEQQRVFDWP